MTENVPFGEGHGVAGRFAGLPDSYAAEEFAEIVILPIPFDKTSSYRQGSDKGPAALIEASTNLELYDIETDSEAYLKGIHTAQPVLANSSKEMVEITYNFVKELLRKEKFVVGLGGEHTVSFPLIKAYAQTYPSLTILQLDAHADLRPAYENNPWSHACVMARVRELDSISNIIAVGIRSLSREEKFTLDLSHTFFAHEIEKDSHWMRKVLERLSGPVYITVDLDVFDSSLMPSTGTPEPGGLQWNTALSLLKKVTQEKQLVGFDVVELCPQKCNPAPDYLAAKLVYKLLSYKFQNRI